MIVQFFRYGNGLSKGPLNYLLGKKRDREHAKILSGSEQEVAALIDSSPFAKKYTSGCLSFYENDLSDEARNKIMADFEKCLFPGMSSDQYRVLWIEHKDKLNEETGERRLELNFLIPNTEILTGKRLQPFYHKADLSRVDLFKKIINFEQQLHDPDDPRFRQLITTQKNIPKTSAEYKAFIDRNLSHGIDDGTINSREDVKAWLTEMGYKIKRESKKSLSIEHPLNPKLNMRLTGGLYDESFRSSGQGREITRRASESYRAEAEQRYGEDLQRYREQLDRKSKDLKQKYQQRDVELEKAGQPLHERARDPDFEQQRVSEKTAEQSHERDYRADYNRQGGVAESTYTSNHRDSGSPQGASRELTGELARVEPFTRRYSTASDFEKSPFEINYSIDCYSLYFDYQQRGIRVLYQDKKRPNSRNASASASLETARGEPEAIHLRQEALCRDQPQGTALRGELSGSSGEVNEQSRSAAIADYRRTTAAVETATATFRAEMRAVEFSAKSIDQNTERTRQIVEQLGESRSVYEPSQGLFDGSFQSNRREPQVIREQSFTSEFVEQLAEKFRAAFTAISDKFKYRESVEIVDRKELIEDFASRDRSADHSSCTAIFEREREGYRVSREVSSFNTGHIFTALEIIDQRKQQKLQQEEFRPKDGMNFDM